MNTLGFDKKPQDTLQITHVTVIDPASRTVRPDMTVTLSGGLIAAVEPAALAAAPEGVRAIDGRGRFLIPGLMDMHVHTNVAPVTETSLALFLAHGITSVRDMAGDCWEPQTPPFLCRDDLVTYNARIDAGALVDALRADPLLARSEAYEEIRNMLTKLGLPEDITTIDQLVNVAAPGIERRQAFRQELRLPVAGGRPEGRAGARQDKGAQPVAMPGRHLLRQHAAHGMADQHRLRHLQRIQQARHCRRQVRPVEARRRGAVAIARPVPGHRPPAAGAEMGELRVEQVPVAADTVQEQQQRPAAFRLEGGNAADPFRHHAVRSADCGRLPPAADCRAM